MDVAAKLVRFALSRSSTGVRMVVLSLPDCEDLPELGKEDFVSGLRGNRELTVEIRGSGDEVLWRVPSCKY